ncbi:chemotaxis protein CheB [Pontibacter chitinilyticus]|uniref:chemotaxis protein CheB n=1 Tax=Pontibacter chitinilyticus TaxID=2674989 RepID=UPI00321A6913
MHEQATLIQVVVAVGTSYSRLVLDDILNAETDIHSAALLTEADTLLQTLREQQPDVVLVDYELPQNRDMLLLKQIFSEVPTPVILLLEPEKLTLELVKEATALGVYAIVFKPGAKPYPDYRSITSELCYKIRAVRQTQHWDTRQRLAYLKQELFASPPIRNKKAVMPATVILIGASTGGAQAIETIIKELSPTFKACVLVVMHLPQNFTHSFARRLQELTPLQVQEGREGMLLKPGRIIIAPGGRDMLVVPVLGNRNNLKISFSTVPTGSFDQPSIDLLMQSVAQSAIKQVIGVILTGMGNDGTLGASHIRSRGGFVIAQDEASSLIFGMARSAINSGFTDTVLPLTEIPALLNRLAEQQPAVSATDTRI